MGNFSDIYGYETIKEHLQSAISMGKVSHAYVISGGLGSGKKLIASTFAQTLQCEAGGVEPCGVCHSCVQAAGRNQPDIIWVGHEKPGSIGVDDIRDQLVSDMQIKPYSSPYKIYIIDEADKLTVAAQNAMLKTIEEPPAYGIVILLANNPDVFLQTILSRKFSLENLCERFTTSFRNPLTSSLYFFISLISICFAIFSPCSVISCIMFPSFS